MNKHFFYNSFILFSLVGVASTVSPVFAFGPVGLDKITTLQTQTSEIVPALTTETKAVTKSETKNSEIVPASTTQTEAVAKLKTTIGEANKLIDADLKETTTTNVGQLAGASTDSLTTASVTDPTKVNLDSLKQQLNEPTEIIQKTGEATVKIKSDEQGIHVDAKADLGVEVAKLATVGICLDGSASLGSRDDGSLANCHKSVKPQEVPEPGAIGGIALLGAYLISRRKEKVLQSVERQSI